MRCVFDLREASSARIPTAPSSSIHGSIASIGRYRDATGSDEEGGGEADGDEGGTRFGIDKQHERRRRDGDGEG